MSLLSSGFPPVCDTHLFWTMAPLDQTKSLEALLSGLSRYSIQNLTINSYGPLTVMGGVPIAPVTSLSANLTIEVPVSDKNPEPITPQWGWATANVRLRNSLEGTLRRVTVYHRRGWDANVVTEKTWENLNRGDTSDVFRTDFQEGKRNILRQTDTVELFVTRLCLGLWLLESRHSIGRWGSHVHQRWLEAMQPSLRRWR